MIVVILFDILCEFLDFFPSWDRRRLLILDDFLRFLYSENELWSERLYNFAFRKDKFKKSVKIEESKETELEINSQKDSLLPSEKNEVELYPNDIEIAINRISSIK